MQCVTLSVCVRPSHCGCRYFQSCLSAWLYDSIMLHLSGSPLFFLLLGNLLRLVRVTQKKHLTEIMRLLLLLLLLLLFCNKQGKIYLCTACCGFLIFFCETITVITINLFLEHFFNSLIPEGF